MSIQRMAPITGLLGPLAVVIGLVTMNAPEASKSDASIDAWFAANGHTQWLLSAIAVAIGGVLLLVFAAVVAARQEFAGVGPIGRHLTLVAATAWGILTLVGASVYASVPMTLIFMGPQAPDASTYRYLGGVFYGILVAFCALAAALLAATLSVTTLMSGARPSERLLPLWLAKIGVVASLLMLANAMMPMFVITLWFAAVSIVMIRRDVVQPVRPPVTQQPDTPHGALRR